MQKTHVCFGYKLIQKMFLEELNCLAKMFQNCRCAHSLTGAIPPQDIIGIAIQCHIPHTLPPKAENRQHLSYFLSYNP